MKLKLLTMKIEDIKHPELKQLINMSYLHGENENHEMIEKTDLEIKDYLSENTFIVSTENNEPLTIPYANDGQYVIPIFTDLLEYETARREARAVLFPLGNHIQKHFVYPYLYETLNCVLLF